MTSEAIEPPANKWARAISVSSDLVTIFTLIGIAYSVGQYVKEAPDRRRQTAFSSWEILSQNEDHRADGGRGAAITQLVEQGRNLAGISLNSAILWDIDLSNQ